MIILDIETSGLNSEKCGIWQIGALELENPQNYFLKEGRIDDEDAIEDGALKVTGKIEKELRERDKYSQKELLEDFLRWACKIRIKNVICENPQFDLGFIMSKAKKYQLEYKLPHRAFDLHSIASLKYFQINNRFLIKNNKSDLGLSNILEFCGLKDERGAHNALEDVKLTAECFSRIVYGKNLISEYNNLQIPYYLKPLSDNALDYDLK